MTVKIPVVQVLDCVGVELDRMHLAVSEVEQTVLGLLETHDIQLDDTVVEKLQHIDLLSQSTAALATYVKTLSLTAKPAGQVETSDAISKVPLNDMRSRLVPGAQKTNTSPNMKSDEILF